jgi:RNA polymerase sigma factor (sigma-70 family)
MMSDDMKLVREYAECGSEQAFSKLVSQHINLVYSVALRQVRDTHLAEEIAQAVFIILARKAKSLNADTVLSGWLCRTARYVSADTLKMLRRRQIREQEAHMQSRLNENEPEAWTHIAPILDDALGSLGQKDHDAVILRYFERKDLREVGAALGMKEDAARMRVNRGLEKLRKFFSRKGVTLSVSAIAASVAANSVQAAPCALSAATVGAALSGTTVTTAAAIAAAKTIAMTALQKTIITATVVVLAGAGIYEARQAAQLHDQNQTLRQQHASLNEQIQMLQRERDEATNQLARIRNQGDLIAGDKADLLKLRAEIARLKSDSRELALLKAAAAANTNDLTEGVMRSWIARTVDLQKRIDQRPGTNIPEFAFLTPIDWLDIAKDVSMETDMDVDKAVQMLGANAKNRFAGLTRDALIEFLKTNNGELPTGMNQLKPFFSIPAEDAVLERYELLQCGNVNKLTELDRNFRLIAEKRTAPIGSGIPIVQIGMQGFIRTGQ